MGCAKHDPERGDTEEECRRIGKKEGRDGRKVDEISTTSLKKEGGKMVIAKQSETL